MSFVIFEFDRDPFCKTANIRGSFAATSMINSLICVSLLLTIYYINLPQAKNNNFLLVDNNRRFKNYFQIR